MTDTATAPAATEAASTAAPAPTSLAADALFKPAAAVEAPAVDTPPAAETPLTETKPEGEAPTEAKPLTMPGNDATPEQWAEFYKQAGAPEKAEDYQVTLPEGDDPAVAPHIQELFKKAGILPHQAEVLLAERNRMFAEQSAAAQKAQADAEAAIDAKNKSEAADLANEWGARQTENMELVRRGATQFIDGGQDKQYRVIAAMEKELGYKETMKFFHGIGKAIGEHDAAGLGSPNGQKAPTKTAAEALYPSMFKG